MDYRVQGGSHWAGAESNFFFLILYKVISRTGSLEFLGVFHVRAAHMSNRPYRWILTT